MKQKNPTHVAIILDGNRRYGRKIGLNPWQGHEFGANNIEQLISWCIELGIKELTLYSFSLDNFKRPNIEKKVLFGLFKENIKKLQKDKRISKHSIKVSFIGKLGMFPKELQDEMQKVMRLTSKNKGFKLNFAMAYSSKAEILDSIKKIAIKLKNKKIEIDEINEKTVNDNLYLSSSPDILIRPGGEKRLSDFLLWQSAYTELVFLEKLWPEFTKEDLIWCIEEFKRRERRFGR